MSVSSHNADPPGAGRATPAPVRLAARLVASAGVLVTLVIVAVVSPVIALVTKLWDVALDTRDQFVRPRPFVGARHGLPFLDAPPRAAAHDPEGPAAP